MWWKETCNLQALQRLAAEEEEACEFLQAVITAGPGSLEMQVLPLSRWYTMLLKQRKFSNIS